LPLGRVIFLRRGIDGEARNTKMDPRCSAFSVIQVFPEAAAGALPASVARWSGWLWSAS
jgi:hypothetical protein